jgi:hypothetical protein
MHPYIELSRSKDSPANLWLGGFVGTHCVYNDVSRHQQGSAEIAGAELRELACFFGHKNVATLVRPALLACTVRELALVAVRALGEAGGGQEVVAAAFGSPLLGVAPFRIRHYGIPFNRPRRLREKNAVDEAKT